MRWREPGRGVTCREPQAVSRHLTTDSHFSFVAFSASRSAFFFGSVSAAIFLSSSASWS